MQETVTVSSVTRLAEALRLIRVFHDLKQYELSDRLGVSNSYISEIETGRKEPSIGIISKYAEEFKIPLSSILFFSEQLNDGAIVTNETADMRDLISHKIIRFLQIIEDRTT